MQKEGRVETRVLDFERDGRLSFIVTLHPEPNPYTVCLSTPGTSMISF